MYKCTFSGTGDGFVLKNLDDVFTVASIGCMCDTCD